MSTGKRCPDCGTFYKNPQPYFYKNSSHKDGLDTYCKDCRKAYQEKQYAKNGYVIRSRQKNYYHHHRTEELERGRKFRQENPDYMRRHYRMNRTARKSD